MVLDISGKRKHPTKKSHRAEITCTKCGWTKLLTLTQWKNHQWRVHQFVEERNVMGKGQQATLV